MRRQPLLWLTISIACFVGAFYFWKLGNKWAKEAPKRAPATNQVAETPSKTPVRLLSTAGNLNLSVTPDESTSATNRSTRFAYRLSNTRKTIGELARIPTAILLENALIDTTQPLDLPIPEHLKSTEEPTAWIVQARGQIDETFRSMIKQSGAQIVAYIPNNAYLVSADASVAKALADRAQAVLPYEPYYKLKSSLLRMASQLRPLPEETTLRVLLFENRADAAQLAIENAGAEILQRSHSPFGDVVNVRPQPSSLPDLAKIPGVQMIELVQPRVPANDLSRVTIGIATNSIVPAVSNYLGLTGSNVMVNVNDTGVDIQHPDLLGRSFADVPANGFDTNGHGTHVAGVIASSGGESESVINAIGSVKTDGGYVDGQFRGKAPGARLFSMDFHSPDVYLQETAARTNALISNNSWEYRNTYEYDLASASYDAAVRDALPEDSGSQPVLYVFAAGNNGNGDENGTGGRADTIVSPATAKNVITVGAVEQPRNVTNKTYKCYSDPSLPPGETFCETNQPWIGETDASDEVASFSSRGNVGVSIEGEPGRFKPDVVAPGTFVISTRSAQWDEAAYYNNTSHIHNVFPDRLIEPGGIWTDGIFLPENAISARIRVFASDQSPMPFPDLPLYLKRAEPPTNSAGGYDFTKLNEIAMPGDYPLQFGDLWYGVGNPGTNPIYVGIITDITVTNDNGNYMEVLKQINDDLGPYYRYESGASMAAAAVSGTLALMQEFFEQRLKQTNSPALMKALLINGARSLPGDLYDFGTRGVLNHQGWGLINLTNTLPAALQNTTAAAQGMPTLMFDQSPTNALASGGSRTVQVEVDSKAQKEPMRVTLVWTDPPGNPAASIKLVNDLDLVVTNLDTGEVFFGNDITVGNDFNAAWNTNSPPNIDYINNVENVYLAPNLGTNYTVTVVGRHVNVNAVTAHPNDVVQDYALVISAGSGTVSNALRVVQSTATFSTIPFVTFVTNAFVDSPDITGNVLYNQHVGASTPLMGTNQIAAPVAGGVITLGMTNQWHFYAITNEMGYTNAAFMTFIPPNLAVPRKGANESDVDNASRLEADIDMYVSTDPGLTILSPVALQQARKSIGRLGSETIILSDAVPGVYYIGIKAEDQQAAEYAFAGVFSLYPFSEEDAMGNQYLRAFPVPQFIQDATLDGANKIIPGTARLFAFSIGPDLVRKVVVTNGVMHELLGDLTGTLTHNRDYATLNNHLTNYPSHYETYYGRSWPTWVYDDSGENTIPGAQQSGGPGTLEDFAGKEGAGQWLFTQVDGAVSHVGTNGALRIYLERQQDLEEGIEVYIEPGACRSDFVRVPAEATNLTVELTILEGSGPVSMTVCPRDEVGMCESTVISNSFGGSVTIDIFDNPPLHEGVYSVRTCNLGTGRVKVRILARIYRSFITEQSISNSAGPVTLKDDAITYAYITNLNHMRISSLDVGLLFNHPRISDMAITLISPNGTRVLLFEDRGGLTTSGMGSITVTTNGLGEVVYQVAEMAPFYETDFDAAPLGVYAPGALIDGWSVLTNYATVLPDWTYPWMSNNILSLADSVVSHNLPGNNSGQYNLSFWAIHAPYLSGTVGWWPLDGDARDVFGGFDGLLMGGGNTTNYGMFLPGEVNGAFFGNAVRTSIMVPAAPELDVAARGRGFSVEGWVYPSNYVAAAPLVEWVQRSNSAPGVQFWLSGLSWTNSQPGALFAGFNVSNEVRQVVNTVTNTLTNAAWQHVAFTYSAADRQARIYANGQLAATQSVPSGWEPDTSGDLYFGFHPADNTNMASLKGGLDEIGLYNRPLTDCEVAAIYRAGALGKYGTNVLTCPIAYEVSLQGDTTSVLTFTNGLFWTNGPVWEQNFISFSNSVKLAENGQNTNRVKLTIRPLTPNVALDDFVLSGLTSNTIGGTMNFTENTNVAVLPIKFAPVPFALSNFPPVLVFSNDFESAAAGLYTNGAVISGLSRPGGAIDWTVTRGPVTVLSNRMVDISGTNSLVLGMGSVSSQLPTVPGRRYALTYSVRGPGAVGWWNGDTDPTSGRALDLIGGNNGAFVHGATNSPDGLVLERDALRMAFDFPTQPFIETNPLPVVAFSPRIELSDPVNLRLTNALTIEGWIYPRNMQTNFTLGVGTYYQQIFYRGDGRDCLDPYYLAVHYDEGLKRYDILFHVEDASGVNCGFDLYSTNAPVEPYKWQHVAAVFESNIPVPGAPLGTNGLPAMTNQLSIYLDGKLIAAQYTPVAPFADLDPAYTPGVAIGNRSRYSRLSDVFTDAEPFLGQIDDIAIYGRALTPTEIQGIYNRNVLGKSDPTAPASQGLAKVQLFVDNVRRDVANGDNARFTTRTVQFTANNTNTIVEFAGLLPGTIIDKMTLIERPAEFSYLPESSLKELAGEDSFGVWKLEMWDTRTGGAITNRDLIQLIEWTLDFRLTPMAPPPVIELSHGITYTNVLMAGEVQHFIVPVPQWAANATNILLSATNRLTGAPAQMGVLFDGTNQWPGSLTNALFWPPVSSGTNVLSTNTAVYPFIVPGQSYFLTVTNPNAAAVSFALGVWFDILSLTNCQPYNGLVGPAGIPTYFQLDVPAPDDSTNRNAREVVMLLTGMQSNLTLVVSQTLPLPNLSRYDYISRMASTNDQVVMVLTNTTPFPLPRSDTRWYAGVFNSESTNVPFTIQACYSASITNAPRLVALTNHIPFVARTNTEFAAPPGPPQWLFYEFDLTNDVDAVLFELYGLSGDADLIVQREVPSGMAPYFDASSRLGRNPESVVVRRNRELGDLRGKWYAGVYNNEKVDVSYTIRASTPDVNGMLNSAQPLLLTMFPAAGPHGITLQWNSIPGEVYVVEFSQTVFPPVWSDLTTIAQPIVATTTTTAVELPISTSSKGFYRIRHVTRSSALVPQMRIALMPDGRIRISWDSTYTGIIVQAANSLRSTWFNTNLPILTEGDESVVYDTLRPGTRFYKLVAQ